MSCLARCFTQRLRRGDQYVCLLLKRSSAAGFEIPKTRARASKPRTVYHSLKTLRWLLGSTSAGNTISEAQEGNARTSLNEATTRLQNFGISETDIAENPEMLKLPLTVIEHRIQYCSEGGLRNCFQCVTKFDYITRTSVSLLKSSGILPSEVNIPQKMLSDIKFKGLPPPPMSEKLSFKEIHFRTLCHYMRECYGFSYPKWKRYMHASLKSTVDNISVLRKARLHRQWIQNHPSIYCFANPSNLSKLLDLENFELPISIYKLLRLEPNVAFVNADDVLAIFFILMKHKVCKHDIVSAESYHFLMNPDLLDQHLKKLKETSPAENANRLSLLYELNYFRCKRKSILGSEPGEILKQEDLLDCSDIVSSHGEGSWREDMKVWSNNKESWRCLEYKPCRHSTTRRSSSLISTLPTKKMDRLPALLARQFDISEGSVKTELSRLPLWFRVEPKDVQETINLLLKYGFKQEEILGSIQLLLYPRNIVEETLKQYVISDPIHGSEVYRQRHLQLCLYFILMRFNFSLFCTK